MKSVAFAPALGVADRSSSLLKNPTWLRPASGRRWVFQWAARLPTLARYLLLGCAVPIAIACFSVPGCYYGGHGHYGVGFVWVDDDFEEFDYGGDFFGYTAVDEFIWENVYDDAYVEFIADDFFGEITIEVYDDHDELVYISTFVGFGDEEYELDLTDLGDEGDWFIRITSIDVFGEVDIFIY